MVLKDLTVNQIYTLVKTIILSARKGQLNNADGQLEGKQAEYKQREKKGQRKSKRSSPAYL